MIILSQYKCSRDLSPKEKMERPFLPNPEKLLGQILIERGVISPQCLELALERQRREGGKYLGEILLEMGIYQEKINEALDHFRKRKPIGEILIDLKVITREQLYSVLEKQEQLKKNRVHKPLGKLLVQMGYTTYDQYMVALSKHFNMPIVSLKDFFPSPDLQRAIGEKYAEKNKIWVIENNFKEIKLAFAEPNVRVMDELRRFFPYGKRMEFYLVHPLEFYQLRRKQYDPFSVSNYI